MTQNIYWPDNATNYISVETELGSLHDYNPDQVALLVNAQFSIPPVAYAGTGPNDSRLSIALPSPSQQEIDDALSTLNAICNDPTRNDLTPDQAETAAIQAHLDALVGLSAADKAYALMGRMFAVRDGASSAIINAIVDRASAVVYVTSKPTWTSLTSASKLWERDSLEMLALVFQVVLLGITNNNE